MLALLGITGGSLYFVSENMAVKIGYVNNVSFIVCSAPLLSTLIALAVFKDVKATKTLIGGSILCVLGIALVIFNGQIILKLNPLGDALALVASLCWAVYTLLLKKMAHYGSVFVTRKVFFYGLVTVLPVSRLAMELSAAQLVAAGSARESFVPRRDCKLHLFRTMELGEQESGSVGGGQLCLPQPCVYCRVQCHCAR